MPVISTRTAGRRAGSIAVLFALALTPGVASGQTTAVPITYFSDLTNNQLQQVQGKLTFTGAQDYLHRSVAFAPSGSSVNLQTFYVFQNAKRYHNDGTEPQTFLVSIGELDGMIESVAGTPALADGQVDTGAFVSFTLVRDEGNGVLKYYEKRVASTNGKSLLTQLRQPVAGNAVAHAALSRFACDCNLVTTPLARKLVLGNEVELKLLTLRQDRATKEYKGKIEIKNLTSQPLPPPLSLAFVFRDDAVELLSPTGYTCLVDPGSIPYVDIPVGSGLAPGATVQATLSFSNPSHAMFETYWTKWVTGLESYDFAPVLLTGPGER